MPSSLTRAVGRAGQRDEQRRAERLAVRRGVGLADRAGVDRPLGQRRGVLPPPGRAVPPLRPRGQHVAAHPGIVDLARRVRRARSSQLGMSSPRAWSASRIGLCVGARLDPASLFVGGVVRLDDRLLVEVPASRHCAARRFLARSAHDGHTLARVCPHGTSTGSVSPVVRSVRLSWTGRMQAPCSTARS